MASTHYAGETILLAHTATFDGEDLTDENTESVSLEIFNSDSEIVLTSTAMVWSSEHERWEYWWDTVDSGRYQVKVTIVTTNGISWEIFKETLKASPV